MEIRRSQDGSISIVFDFQETDSAVAVLKVICGIIDSEEAKQTISEVVAALEYETGVHYDS